MSEEWIVWTFLALLSIIHGSSQCPALCTCSTNQVVCSAANFTAIPRLIPHATTTLDLSHNHIHHVTLTALTSLRNMVELNFEQNLINTIDEGAFQTMDSLQKLDLSDNKLSSIMNEIFIGVNMLSELDLGNNHLQHIDGAFAGLKSVTRLDLRQNQIHRITQVTFKDLENLRYLYLADNQISHIDRRAFKNMEKLMYLVLKGNPIHRIPKFEFHSQFLSYMDLSECNFSDIPRGLPNSLRYLQLRRNNVTQLSKRSFRDCPYVSILVLDENGIHTIEDDTFQSMAYLQQLWLNGNQLNALPKLLPVSLQRLLMDQNHVTYVDQSFPRKSQIHTLSLMGNDIAHIKYDAFGRLKHLETLDLSNNEIRNIYGNMFENNTELNSLLIAKNPLEYFHSHAFWGLQRLKTLSLAYVETHVHIHPDSFNDLQNLDKLELDSSPYLVKALLDSPHLTQHLRSVRELSMENCELAHLDDSFPSLFPNLTTLWLSSSLWHCDTELRWLRTWLESGAVVHATQEPLTCYSPPRLHGRTLHSLAQHEYGAVTSTTPDPYAQRTTSPAFTTFPPARSTTIPSQPTSSRAPTEHAHDTDSHEASPTDPESQDHDVHNNHQYLPDLGHIDFGDIDKDPDERDVTWEDFLSRSPIKPHPERTTKFPNPGYNHSGEKQHERSTGSPLGASVGESQDPGGGPLNDPSNITIIIIIVSIATAIIASIIIALIIYFVRKQRTVKEKPSGYQNGIPLKHKNDVLYFTPNGTKSQSNGDTIENKSITDSTKTLSSSKSKTKEHVTLLPGRDITLVPGRDINHEGPMRVYKWEDF